MRSSAAVAASSLVAATAATGSPTKRTLSSASACSSWLTGRMPKGTGRSRPVSTARTPGARAAASTFTERTRAWGCGERSSLPKSIRGSARSSANSVSPVTLAVASTLRCALPTTRSAAGRSSFESFLLAAGFFLPPAIERLLRRLRGLAAHPGRRELHRLVDLDVTGTAAEVACERFFYLVARGTGIGAEEGLGREQEGGRAVTALGGADLGERVLEGVETPVPRHPLDGLHAMARAGHAQHQAGQDRDLVQEHGAGPALPQLAAVLGPGEAQVLTQHLEQSLVGSEGDRNRLVVDEERDLRQGVGHWPCNLAPSGRRRQLLGCGTKGRRWNPTWASASPAAGRAPPPTVRARRSSAVCDRSPIPPTPAIRRFRFAPAPATRSPCSSSS